MIIQGNQIEVKNGRRPYDLGGRQIVTGHFVVRDTTPANPFGPHKHEKPELWYVISGQATVTLDGILHDVVSGDLIVIDPWIEHGLHTDVQATWICLG